MSAAAMGLTPEQLEIRRTGITATSIAKLAGVSAYGGPLSVWLDIKGLLERGELGQKAEWGHRLQRPIADYRVELLNRQGERAYALREPGTVRHPKHTIALCTPDYIIMKDGVDESDLEIKNTGLRMAHMWGEPGTAAVPVDYFIQVHWQLFCMPWLAFAEIAVLIGGQEPGIYRIERDEDLEASLFEIAERFWVDHVVADVQPEIDGSDDARRYLASKHPRVIADVRPAPPEARVIADRLLVLREQAKELDEERAELEARMKELIGDAEGFDSESWRATWKVQDAVEVKAFTRPAQRVFRLNQRKARGA